MAEIRQRLSEARALKGWSQEKLADAYGVQQATIQRYESGARKIRADEIKTLADLLGVSVPFLMGVSDDPTPIEVLNDDEAEIPVYGSIAAGIPIEMIPVDELVSVPGGVKRHWPNAFFLKVKGTSMDRILPDGCLALIDPCDEVERPGKPYAVCVNGYDATIKRVNVLANGFELSPDSTDPTYKPKIYDYGEEGTEEITIIGQVVWYMPTFNWSF